MEGREPRATIAPRPLGGFRLVPGRLSLASSMASRSNAITPVHSRTRPGRFTRMPTSHPRRISNLQARYERPARASCGAFKETGRRASFPKGHGQPEKLRRGNPCL